MIEKDESVYLEHMLECIHRISDYVDNKEQFYSSHLVQDAVIRNLQTMSESSQRVSDATKGKYPNVPWKQLSGFRNILVHDYLGVDLDILWNVIDRELPALAKILPDIV